MRWSFSPKRFLQGVLQDAKEIFQPVFGFVGRLWAFAGPRLTNRAAIAMVLADCAVVFHLETSETQIGLVSMAIWVAANLITPLSRPGAPQRVPPPPSPAPAFAGVNPHGGPPLEDANYAGQAYHYSDDAGLIRLM